MILTLTKHRLYRLQNNFVTCLLKLYKVAIMKNMQFHTLLHETPQKVKKGWRTQNVLAAGIEYSFISINCLIYF